MLIAAIDDASLARTGDEYLSLLASTEDRIARTKDDVLALRDAGGGPFAKLTQADFDAFLASLTFDEQGLVTGSYKPLLNGYITLSDVFAVFERFGMARDYFSRILEAKCVGSDWEFEFWSFCASNCGGAKKA